MANKEERIIIAVAEPSLLEGGADKVFPCMTRQEAIRKMCDAYFKAKDKGLMESERVEAALNALLQKEK